MLVVGCWFPPTKFYDFVIKICLSTNDLTIVAAVSELLSLLPLSAQSSLFSPGLTFYSQLEIFD